MNSNYGRRGDWIPTPTPKRIRSLERGVRRVLKKQAQGKPVGYWEEYLFRKSRVELLAHRLGSGR